VICELPAGQIRTSAVTPLARAIGDRDTNADEGAQDWADAQDLYRLLENDIVPMYYERDADGLPRRWLEVMKAAMATSVWQFSTTRMLQDYSERLYLPAAGVETPATVARPVVTEAG